MAGAPAYIGGPLTWSAQISVANTNRDGSGTLVPVVAGGSLGSRVDWIRIIGVGNVTNGVVRLFLIDQSNNKRLIKEQLVTTTTPSTTVEEWYADLSFLAGLIVPNGFTLSAATHNAETFNVFAFGGNF